LNVTSPHPQQIYVQDLTCPLISVAVIAEHVVVLLHEEVGGITHGGLCNWAVGQVQWPGCVDSKFSAAAVSSFWPGFSLSDRLFCGLLMIFWPCQKDEGNYPELECPFPFNLVTPSQHECPFPFSLFTPSQHNTQAMEEIFCANSGNSVVW